MSHKAEIQQYIVSSFAPDISAGQLPPDLDRIGRTGTQIRVAGHEDLLTGPDTHRLTPLAFLERS